MQHLYEKFAHYYKYFHLMDNFMKLPLNHAHLKSWQSINTSEIKSALKIFEEYLNSNPNEKLKYEHCDSAEEVREMIKILRAIGALHGSTAFSHLIDAVIDESNLQDKLVLEDQQPIYNRKLLN